MFPPVSLDVANIYSGNICSAPTSKFYTTMFLDFELSSPLPVINVDTNHLSYAENLVCFGIQILCEFIRWLHELLLLLNICNIDLGGEGGLYVFEISLVVCKTKTFKKVD